VTPRDADSAATEDAAMLFRALVDHGNLPVGVADATGRLTMRSRGLRELAGVCPYGAAISDLPRLLDLYNAEGTALLDPADLPLVRATRGEAVRDVVISARRPGEPVRYLRCDAVPLTATKGHPSGAIVLVADVTREAAAVSRQDTIRSLLLDTVNHELRTPLSVVLANAELITDAAGDLPDHVRRPLSAIVRASGRLRDTIQQVSRLVDLEAASHAVRSDTKVRDILVAVAERHRERARARNVTLELDCDSALDWSIDAAQARRAVAALLDNAILHGPSDSKITLGADVIDDLLRLRVTDGGDGIPPHEEERLTKPFERGRALGHDSRHTLGLGLPLAQAVATSHQGALSFRHEPSRGFTACLLLA